jgi:hypothetical protein
MNLRPFLLLALTLGFLTHTLSAEEVGIRVRLGVNDKTNTVWSGSAEVAPGKIESVSGWRFQFSDAVVGNSWTAETRTLTIRRGSKGKKGEKKKNASEPMADNGVILHLLDVTEDSVVKIKTPKGDLEFSLKEVPYGKILEKLDGAVDIERTAATGAISSEHTDDDFPSVAVQADGTVYTAFVSFTPGLDRNERAKSWTEAPKDFDFLAKLPGGDQLWLAVSKPDGKTEKIAITEGAGDLYKTATALDGDGKLWIFWSENKAWKSPKAAPNFEIWACSFQNGKLSEPVNLSQNEGNDVSPVTATDSTGKVWVAWQGVREGKFRILSRHQNASGWSPEILTSSQTQNCWTPAISTSKDGRIAIAWDTYEKGDYDIWMREYSAATGKAQAAQAVTQSPLYEARPSIAYDTDNRLWICWELSGATWGKDWGAYERETGIGLYRDRQIGMRVWADGKWMSPETSVVSALPGAPHRKGPKNLPARTPEPPNRSKGEEAENEEAANTYNNLGQIVSDRDGRIWLLARSREGSFHTPLGTVWMNYAAYFDGAKWVGPILVPHSDNLLYNLPAVAAHPQGGIVAVHSSDHRQSKHIQRLSTGSNAALSSDKDPFDNDLFLSRLEFPSGKVIPSLKPAKIAVNLSTPAAPTSETLQEREEVQRARAYRMDLNGTPLQIIRGEFHRHTEISGDGSNDGPLEDMWRYALDVAEMDWLGNGDHDNGAGREYPWWLTQKTTDAFRIAGKFEPPFTYERSVVYPEGHRNVVFAQRGVRTLPRLPISKRDDPKPAPDTDMLYKYLHTFHGVCASHTSATNMGTDWRNSDPEVEPMVEIYQGARQNYERPGAPRCPTADDAIGGWEPLGFVNLALQKGIRFSFQSSSDHGSTHISYALVYAENNSREALLKAMRLRHTYAATDNIIAEYTCKSGGKTYMMGDVFSTDEAPTLNLHLIGTAPFAKVVLVKDDVEIQTWEPGKADLTLTWTDPKPEAGKTSYYYFRGEQKPQPKETNGELVWASPMWITFNPAKK